MYGYQNAYNLGTRLGYRQGGASIPPIPSTADIFACWSTYGITAGYQDGLDLLVAYGDTSNNVIPTTASEPYPLDWSSIIPIVGANPKVSEWKDQGGGDYFIEQNIDAAWRPTVNVAAQRFDFDGTNDFLSNGGINYGTNTVTAYVIFRTTSIVTEQTLFQCDYGNDFSTTTRNFFCVYINGGGRLVASQSEAATIFNTRRTAVLTANTTYIATIVFDRTQATLADQTLIYLNNVSTGTSIAASDMASINFDDGFSFGVGLGKPTSASDAYLSGSMMHLSLHNTAHNSTTVGEWYNRLNYMKTYSGW